MEGFIYNRNKGVQYPLVYFDGNFYEFCNNRICRYYICFQFLIILTKDRFISNN